MYNFKITCKYTLAIKVRNYKYTYLYARIYRVGRYVSRPSPGTATKYIKSEGLKRGEEGRSEDRVRQMFSKREF